MTATSPPSLLPVAVLISGGGTTLKNLLAKIAAGELPIEIRLVVSSSATAKGLDYARDAGIPTLVVERREHADVAAFSRALFEACRQARAQLIVCAGFLKLLDVPPDFEQRMLNIHPSLIPAFCGHGFYGLRVHAAALEHGVKLSGCTVHFVDNEYDHGPIVLQRAVPVRDDDTPETLAARVFAAECEALPEAIRLYAAGRLRINGRRVSVLPAGE